MNQPEKKNTSTQKVQFSLLYFSSNEADYSDNKYDLFLETGKFADRHGFTAIWIPERHFHPFGGLFPNPVVLSAHLAAVTDQIRLRAGSVVLPLHNPVRVAEDWSVVDNLSDGRVDIAFAKGWNPDDFTLAPDNFANNQQLMFDGIKQVRNLWQGQAQSLPNGIGKETEISIYPRPKQTDLAVWITCSGGEERFREAGAAGENVLTALLFQSIEELTHKIRIYRQARAEHGHDPETGTVTCMLHTYVGTDMSTVRQQVREPFINYLKSSVNLWRSGYSDLEDLAAAEQDDLLEYAFERYFQKSALFGTPETCLDRVRQLSCSGVNEVACLIDFGLDDSTILSGLHSLNELRMLANYSPVQLNQEQYRSNQESHISPEQHATNLNASETISINSRASSQSTSLAKQDSHHEYKNKASVQQLKPEWVNLSPQRRQSQLIKNLRELGSDIFRRDLSEYDKDEPLTNLGIDSLMAVQLKCSIKEQLGMEFSATALLEGVSLTQLAGILEEQANTPDTDNPVPGFADTACNPAANIEPPPDKLPDEAITKHEVQQEPATQPGQEENIPNAFYQFDQFPEYLNLEKIRNELTVENPYFREHEGINANTTRVDGRELINFSSYNYLGMSGDPVVVDAVVDATRRYGTSVSASRLISGEIALHRELEQELAAFIGVESALLYVAGHATNVTTIGHMLSEQDLVLYDEWSHNSILQGIDLSGAQSESFAHNNWNALEQILKQKRHHYRRVLIVIEGVYSMDGDIPELKPLIAIKKRYRALLMIDEAHSIGTIGSHGRGISEYAGIDANDVDIWMGTLSKSFATCGGYIAGSQALIDYLKYTAPGFVYSVGISPPNTASALAALRLLKAEPERVQCLHDRARLFLELAAKHGMNTGPSNNSPVIPLIVGNSSQCMQLSAALATHGISVFPIVFPAVPDDAARLRFFISSTHTEQQIHFTVEKLAEELEKVDTRDVIANEDAVNNG